MLENSSTCFTYLFPWSIIIAVLLAILFAIIGIVLFRGAIKKGEEDVPQEKISPFLEKSRTFLSRFGFFPTNSLNQSFTHALEIMHSFIGGRQSRYQLPWFVMLGSSEAGKSTVLQTLDLDRPVGRPHFEGEGEDKVLCEWWFYDHGIVLDLDGKIVLNAMSPTSKEEDWQLFVNLLARNRPKRPLDGVVLTIPASEFVGSTALSHDDIMLRAEYLYGKLWEMQRLTGMRVPIYIIVSKCDLVPGFDNFCKSIPPRNGHDIFGWSNDQAVDSNYTSEWIDRAFSSLNNYLYQAQEEIYADGKIIDGREGVFLFPLTFNQLKSGIQNYADHLFKPSGYHESFFLRGIYFVGDSQLEKPASIPESPLALPKIFRQEANEPTRNLYFIDNLFENKIFREVGLARPVSQILLGNTSVIRFAKIVVAIGAIVGTLGLLRANEDLQTTKTNLVPALTQIDATLEKLHGQNEGTSKRIFFNEQAQVLLNTMTQISVNRIFSLFIPASWFDTLDGKIKYVMGLAYDHVILRSMASQLDYKAQQTVSLDSPVAFTDQVGNGINPLTTAEFYRLRNYIVSVRALELAANKYNELAATSSLKDVADIIKYLFNYDMPRQFYDHDAYYVDAVRHTNAPAFDYNTYQDSASLKLQRLFSQFQSVAFDPSQMVPGLGHLMTSIYVFSGERNYSSFDADLLREIFVSLQETINSIEKPGFQWLDADHFNPGPQYGTIVGLMIGSNLFNNSISSSLPNEADQNFIKFRQLLASYQSPLFKGETLFKAEADLAVNSPTQGALTLQESLAIFFKEPFMVQKENKDIITDVPIGSILLWDTLRLQEAVNLVSVYNSFMSSRLLNMPKVLQPLLQKVARESLTKIIVGYIADAEVFSSDASLTRTNVPEDALLSQVQNYRAVAPYLEQLLIALKENNANAAFSSLKSLLTKQVYFPLEKLNDILMEEAPYAIRMNSFDWWNGKNMAALEAFGVSSVGELKNYLEVQRDRINYLAREFVDPLASFLKQINQEGMPGNLSLVTKWERIINELSGYERKAPGNALVELESFVTDNLNEVTLATCKKYAGKINLFSTSQDLFSNVLVNLQEKLYERCESLSGYVSADNYSELSQFFNANLAGKFPFVEQGDVASPDADPEDIRTFFEMMDSQGGKIKDTLTLATNLGPAGKNSLTFIEQMEQVRKFFGDYLAPNSSLSTPAFSFDVTFRVNKGRELRANEILHWEVTTQDTTVSMRSPSHKGYWSSGNPMKVIFRWARNSPLQPQLEDALNFSVCDGDAVFSYNGTWAFLRLLRQHHAAPSDFNNLNDQDPLTLRFDIPLTNIVSNVTQPCSGEPPKATVFIRLKVSPVVMAPAKNGGTSSKEGSSQTKPEKVRMGTPVNLPYFPFQAPRLDQSEGSL